MEERIQKLLSAAGGCSASGTKSLTAAAASSSRPMASAPIANFRPMEKRPMKGRKKDSARSRDIRAPIPVSSSSISDKGASARSTKDAAAVSRAM